MRRRPRPTVRVAGATWTHGCSMKFNCWHAEPMGLVVWKQPSGWWGRMGGPRMFTGQWRLRNTAMTALMRAHLAGKGKGRGAV